MPDVPMPDINVIRNENFIPSSYNASVDDHVLHMLRDPIFAEENQRTEQET